MQQVGIADQVRLAFQITTRVPAIVGAVFGAAVPALAFAFSHFGPPVDTFKGALSAVFVAFCLGFSIPKVVKWGASVFQGRGALLEAWSFALVMESGMVLAAYIGGPVFLAVSCVCLAILVAVNALSTACSAALGQRAVNEARREAARELERNPDTLGLTTRAAQLTVVRPAPRPVRITAQKRKAVR